MKRLLTLIAVFLLTHVSIAQERRGSEFAVAKGPDTTVTYSASVDTAGKLTVTKKSNNELVWSRADLSDGKMPVALSHVAGPNDLYVTWLEKKDEAETVYVTNVCIDDGHDLWEGATLIYQPVGLDSLRLDLSVAGRVIIKGHQVGSHPSECRFQYELASKDGSKINYILTNHAHELVRNGRQRPR